MNSRGRPSQDHDVSRGSFALNPSSSMSEPTVRGGHVFVKHNQAEHTNSPSSPQIFEFHAKTEAKTHKKLLVESWLRTIDSGHVTSAILRTSGQCSLYRTMCLHCLKAS